MENIGTITWEMFVLGQFEKSIAMSVVLYCTVLYCTVLYCTVLSASDVGKGQTGALDVPRTGMSP